MRGECGPEHPLSGFYFREARFLRTLRLEINGERPWLCETASRDPQSLAMNFVHPEIKSPGGVVPVNPGMKKHSMAAEFRNGMVRRPR
jgi:hypothetical protein